MWINNLIGLDKARWHGNDGLEIVFVNYDSVLHLNPHNELIMSKKICTIAAVIQSMLFQLFGKMGALTCGHQNNNAGRNQNRNHNVQTERYQKNSFKLQFLS